MSITSHRYLLVILFILALATLIVLSFVLLPHLQDFWQAVFHENSPLGVWDRSH